MSNNDLRASLLPFLKRQPEPDAESGKRKRKKKNKRQHDDSDEVRGRPLPRRSPAPGAGFGARTALMHHPHSPAGLGRGACGASRARQGRGRRGHHIAEGEGGEVVEEGGPQHENQVLSGTRGLQLSVQVLHVAPGQRESARVWRCGVSEFLDHETTTGAALRARRSIPTVYSLDDGSTTRMVQGAAALAVHSSISIYSRRDYCHAPGH